MYRKKGVDKKSGCEQSSQTSANLLVSTVRRDVHKRIKNAEQFSHRDAVMVASSRCSYHARQLVSSATNVFNVHVMV
ncbi:hypothetical protein NECAME_17122 [Necator americanus]|uniref:Uncharacterized protein n=1 Tax=Necator americanus TaxID=51031 RepID=W2TRR4_NECAM|nr:hypothetical protein NECAME_17122 [Necator americanus]ETN84508.1 hypothetical protein NECAME_17122 [Necator americanus]